MRSVRASSIPAFFQCPRYWVEKVAMDHSLGSAEAQTGNLVHHGMAVFHASKKKNLEERKREAMEAIKEAHKTTYTGGDLGEAEMLFRVWYNREISVTKGEVIGSEIAVQYEWPVFFHPSEIEAFKQQEKEIELAKKAGKKVPRKMSYTPKEYILITGHIDEIRLSGTEVFVCDEKTGWTAAAKMSAEYVPQIAAYVIGAKKFLEATRSDITGYSGYVKRTRDLQNGVGEYFYRMLENYEQALDIMLAFSLRQGEISSGVIAHIPGDYCEKRCSLAAYPACTTGKKKPPAELADGAKASGKGRKALPSLLTGHTFLKPPCNPANKLTS